jgi:hypothetical protein
MNTLQPNRTGLVFAVLLGGWHLLWSLLVAVGWAQPLVDFIFKIHFIKPVIVIEQFSIHLALLLVLLTAAIGYVAGWIVALLWNQLHKS